MKISSLIDTAKGMTLIVGIPLFVGYVLLFQPPLILSVLPYVIMTASFITTILNARLMLAYLKDENPETFWIISQSIGVSISVLVLLFSVKSIFF